MDNDNTRVYKDYQQDYFNKFWGKDFVPDNSQLKSDDRSTLSRAYDNLFGSPIGELYTQASESGPGSMILPNAQNMSSLWKGNTLYDKAGGAVELATALPVAGLYKGVKKTSSLVDASKAYLSKSSNELSKSITPRLLNDLNTQNNRQALTELVKFSDKKGYGLPKSIVSYAKDQNKTDAVIRNIMDRNNTFARGVSTDSESQAREFLNTIPGETGAGRYGLEKGQHALYTSNSLGTAEGYTYGKGYIGKIKFPTDYSNTSRIEWINANKELPKGVIKQDFSKYESLDPKRRMFERRIDRLDVSRERARRIFDEKTKDISDWMIENGPFSDTYDANDYRWKIYNDANDAYEKSAQPYYKVSNDYNKYLENAPHSGMRKITPAYKHYVFQGTPGDKVGEIIDIKQITPNTWKNKSRAHEGEYSKGLSLAALTGLLFGNKDR